MSGWREWGVFLVSSVAVSAGVFVIVFNPLLALLVGGAAGLATWLTPTPNPGREPD